MRFQDKVIAITGGGSGLGRECALRWASEGAAVVVLDFNEARANDVAALVEADGGRALAFACDVTVEAQVAEAVDATVAELGGLDVMFANAGKAPPGLGKLRLEEFTEAQWDDAADVALKGVFFAGKHACRVMKERGGGNIVVTTSGAGIMPHPGLGPYNVAKSGVIGLVKSMAFDWGCYGIRVNALAPLHGMPMTFVLPPDAEVRALSYEEARLADSGAEWDPKTMFPGPLKIGRPPSVQDNVNVATFLASDDSQYMSGVVIPSCDGGSLSRTSLQIREAWVAGIDE